MPRSKSLLILLMLVAPISAHAQAVKPPALSDKLAAVFGAVVFDSLIPSIHEQAETHWLVRDSLTFRLLSPSAKGHAVHLEITHGVYPTCPWLTPSRADSLARATARPAGRLIELSTRVDSAGHLIASASLGCSTSSAESPRERHRGYGTGIAFEIVLKDGVWRIVREIDRWAS